LTTTESQITSGKAESIEDDGHFKALLSSIHFAVGPKSLATATKYLIAHIKAVREKDKAAAFADGGVKAGATIAKLTQQAIAAEADRDHWKANHADVVARLKIATERPDLPIDRIPAIKELERLQEHCSELAARLGAALSGQLAQAARQAAGLSSLAKYSREMRGGQHGRIGFEDFYAVEDVAAILSPAQQEPATPLPKDVECMKCGGIGLHVCKETASITDVAQKAIEALEIAMNNLGASRPTPEWAHDRMLWDTYQSAIDGLRANPAQATPEGGISEQKEFEKFGRSIGLWLDVNAVVQQPAYNAGWTKAAWAAWQARAVLATIKNEAEPVGEIVRDGFGYLHFHASVDWEQIGEGTKLYRAAPLQQVEKDN